MNHNLNTKVYYSDTDAYGVVWHGAYLRWMEMGRVEFCETLGLSLKKLAGDDIVLPVVELNVRYKSSAVLDDHLIVETSIEGTDHSSVTFAQTIRNAETGRVNLIASVRVVAINSNGKLYRKLPEVLTTLPIRSF